MPSRSQELVLESLQLMNLLEQSDKDSKRLALKTLSQTEEHIESSSSQQRDLKTTLVELLCLKRLQIKLHKKELTSLNSQLQRTSSLESKQTRVQLYSQELKKKTQLQVQMVLLKELKSITKKELDSLNGELYSRLEMEDLLFLLSKKMLTPQLDMLLSLKKTDWFPLLSQRS